MTPIKAFFFYLRDIWSRFVSSFARPESAIYNNLKWNREKWGYWQVAGYKDGVGTNSRLIADKPIPRAEAERYARELGAITFIDDENGIIFYNPKNQ